MDSANTTEVVDCLCDKLVFPKLCRIEILALSASWIVISWRDVVNFLKLVVHPSQWQITGSGLDQI